MEKQITDKLMHQFHQLSRRIFEKQRTARGMDLLRGQGRLLRSLNGEDGISQKDLAAKVNIRAGSLSELIVKMEQKNYVRREIDAADRRRYNIFITDEGKEVAELTKKARNIASKEIFSVLSKKEQQELLVLLEKLLIGIDNNKVKD